MLPLRIKATMADVAYLLNKKPYMKNFHLFAALVASLGLLLSCSKNATLLEQQTKRNQEGLTVVEKFKQKQVLSKNHERMLEFAYSFLGSNEGKNIIEKREINTVDVQKITSRYIQSYYSPNSGDFLELTKLNSKLEWLLSASAEISKSTPLSTFDKKVLNGQNTKYLDAFFQEIVEGNFEDIESPEELTERIQNILLRVVSSNHLDEYQIESLIFIAAILDNSMHYWTTNYSKWYYRINGKNFYVSERGFWKDLWKAAKHCAIVLGSADAGGAAAYAGAAAATVITGGVAAAPAGAAVAAAAGGASIAAGVGDILSNL